MPCDDRTPRVWVTVRNESIFELSLSPSDDAYAQDVRFIINPNTPAQKVEVWRRQEVTPGPMRKKLTAGNKYEAQVVITYMADDVTSVDVQARVLRPNGQQHGRSFCEHHSGKKGERPDFSLLAIFMRP